MNYQIGQRVKIKASYHWRANDTGTIIDIIKEGPRQGRFEIMFDKPGIGYGNGFLLCLGREDFDAIDD